MKTVALTVLLFVSCVRLALGQLTTEANEVLQAAYSGELSELPTTLERISRMSFPTEGHRVIAQIQTYAASEKPEHVAAAKRIAEQYIAQNQISWTRDFIRMQLAAVLALNGERKAGCELAEEIIADGQLEKFGSVNDPMLSFVASRVGIGVSQMPDYLRDNLLRQVGDYYLNRSIKEGGPDLQKSADTFGSIGASDLRKACLADGRLKQVVPKSSPVHEKQKSGPQQRAVRDPVSSLVAAEERGLPPHKVEKPSGWLKEMLPDLGWNSSIISIFVTVVVFVMVGGVLWKWQKKKIR